MKAQTVSNEEHLKELMTTLDDAWNAQDLESEPAQDGYRGPLAWPPRHARCRSPQAGGARLLPRLPDQHLDNRPYKVLIASDGWTCSVARFKGTFTGPMKGPDGSDIPPTGFCNSPQMNSPEAYIQFKPGLITDDGDVTVASTEQFLRTFMEEFHLFMTRC